MSPVPSDPYNFVTGAVADADQVDARFAPLYASLAGALDAENLATAVRAALALSDPTTSRRGMATVTTPEARASAVVGDLATVGPSVLIEVPATSLVLVYAKASINSPGAGQGRVHLALDGANQGQIMQGTAGVSAEWATNPGSVNGSTQVAVQGGLLALILAAGTHTLRLQYSSSAGSSTFSNRILAALALGF